MVCKKCNAELPENSAFCNLCGAKTSTEATKDRRFKKVWVLIGSVVGILAIIIGLMFSLTSNNPVHSFKKAVQQNNYATAVETYKKQIKGNLKRESEVDSFLRDNIKEIKQGYSNGKYDYSVATLKLETIKKTNLLTTELNQAFTELKKLNDSRTAFKMGEEFLKNNNLKDGLSSLNYVIEDDDNYSTALNLIKDASTVYKSSILGESETLASEQNYNEAIKIINEALAILTGDSDLTSKKAIYEKINQEKQAEERKKKVETLKENQEISVVSAKVVKTGYYTDFYHTQVVIKNNTEKVLKNYKAHWFAYDSNGYPIKLDSTNFLETGKASAVNVQPGESHGSDSGWSIYSGGEKAKTIIAIVREAEYYDGTVWENEYYDYWLEEYREQPLTD